MINDIKKKLCSFCKKKQEDVEQLIFISNINICNQCIYLCFNILKKKKEKIKKEINFLKPKEIHKYLNKYIIGQDHAKKILSVAAHNHYKKINYQENEEIELEKSNILLIGPTGTGKTLLSKILAKILKVPFVITDATTLTEAGYVGEDVENILRKLLKNCNYDIKKAEKGIICIDEIDKIAKKSKNISITRDVSGEGVQQSLLKIIEGTIASVPQQGGRKHPHQDCININTSKILFICSGSFFGLKDIIFQRLKKKQNIGFNSKQNINPKENKNILSKIKTNDLLKFGMIPEFIGRLPIIATLEKLDKKQLVEILYKPKNSLIKQYKKLFSLENINLTFNQESLQEIAKQAIKKNVGARGLRMILEKLLLHSMYEAPSIKNINTIHINKNVVKRKISPEISFIKNNKKI